ncbi:MAG: hypothetical protein P8Y53_15265, partial [Pseudolabrys sp.]
MGDEKTDSENGGEAGNRGGHFWPSAPARRGRGQGDVRHVLGALADGGLQPRQRGVAVREVALDRQPCRQFRTLGRRQLAVDQCI